MPSRRQSRPDIASCFNHSRGAGFIQAKVLQLIRNHGARRISRLKPLLALRLAAAEGFELQEARPGPNSRRGAAPTGRIAKPSQNKTNT